MAPFRPYNEHITITTDRLILRKLELKDAVDMFAIRSDPEVVKYTWVNSDRFEVLERGPAFLTHFSQIVPETSVKQSEKWIQERLDDRDAFNFAVELGFPDARGTHDSQVNEDSKGSSPRMVGVCGIIRSNDTGYLFNRQCWGKGYATEALSAIIESYWATFSEGIPGVEEGKKHRLLACTEQANVASESVLAKCGFEICGKEVEVDEQRGEVPLHHWELWRPGKRARAYGDE
ncbi:hypothetical protein MMC20_001365 [Loxospora ochrophaea]|nr:hypothetical protein [Loxospora ochrophaea]